MQVDQPLGVTQFWIWIIEFRLKLNYRPIFKWHRQVLDGFKGLFILLSLLLALLFFNFSISFKRFEQSI